MNHLFTRIIKAGLIVGTLDILSAFIYYFIKTGETNFFQVLKYVSSGILGKTAFSGDNAPIFLGLFLHYLIAFSFTIFFFLLYPKVSFLSKNIILTGVMYGIFVWVIMNIIIVPLSNIPPRAFNPINALINGLILIVCIGIPLSYMANVYYIKVKK